jgi:Fe-S-cluster containining protein
MKTKEQWVTGKIRLSIEGEPLEFQVTVPAKPVKLRKMLPVFQMMTNSIVKMSQISVEAAGEKISCKKGCGACCRQPVPISETEALEIANLVEHLPSKKRQKIEKRFAEAVEHFRKIGWFEKLENTVNAPETLQSVVLEYFYQGIPCPFLENESCSIHPNRPLSCREYLVTSPADNCSKPSAEGVKRVKLLFLPSKFLMRIEAKDKKRLPFVPLIKALEWAKENKHREEILKTGEEWMASFFRELTGSEIPRSNEN